MHSDLVIYVVSAFVDVVFVLLFDSFDGSNRRERVNIVVVCLSPILNTLVAVLIVWAWLFMLFNKDASW